jgi:hypothetical protein
MLDLLRDTLKSDAGSFGFVFALLCLIVYAVHKITKFTTKIETEHGSFGKRVDKIEGDIDKIRGDVLWIKTQFLVIKEEIADIKTRLFSKLPPPESYTESRSPLSLSEAGENMAKELKMESRIIENWEKIKSYIDKNVSDKNAYDIQMFCIETATVNLTEFFSDNDINVIKLHAYNIGRAVETFGSLIGIMIRDKYFSETGIKIVEVDNYDPNKTQ